ncbi:MAG TPA: fibronectin type III domain-containing protein [Clostridia bacterium]|nr:fibronectin type III domain-containing protein [Clostridia bacterium]
MKKIRVSVKCGAVFLVILSMLCSTTAAFAYSSTDTQSPTAPKELTAVNATHTAISLSWAASKDDKSVKGYQVYRDGKKITSASKTTYTNTRLVPGRTYTYAVRAYDAAGNISESSNVITASTISDLQAPSAPGGLKAASVTHTSASLTWKPSTDNVGVKGYEIYINGKKAASTSTAHYDYKKLTPGTANTLYIKAYDDAGNYSSQSSSISVNTLPDETAPSPPVGLKASSVTLTEVNLTWSPAADNVQVRGYDIIRDGIKIGTSTKTSYCSKGLFPGKSYTYTVRASDISGNLSSSSSQVNVATLKDQQAPKAPTGLKVADIKNSSVYLEWKASTDNGKVAGYQIYCNGIVISTAAGTSRKVTNPFGPGSIDFYIRSYDQAGNLSDSSNTATAVTP